MFIFIVVRQIIFIDIKIELLIYKKKLLHFFFAHDKIQKNKTERQKEGSKGCEKIK